MTDTAIGRSRVPPMGRIYPLAVFLSAALVFLVEPMIAQLLLPRLGGSPAVWNTSLAFFQIALLAGYAYAHLLQRMLSLRRQVMIHLGVLVLAGLPLPLHLVRWLGPGSADHPILWLLAILTVSIGAPFAALSATAPLLQAWLARGRGEGTSPYGLYAASNLGSLLALLAYPAVIQPFIGLRTQSLLWTGGYAVFTLAILAMLVVVKEGEAPPSQPRAEAPEKWRERAGWILLAAAPSSLLLGVTAHITADVASVPFLWIPPLALYLLTFVIAFQAKPLIGPEWPRRLQALAAPASLWLVSIRTHDWAPLLALHLAVFFLTALVCHQALASRRPGAARLTEFYLCLSLGGVMGGAFNAFLAPLIFNDVWEYPLVLALAALAWPTRSRPAYGVAIALLLSGLGAEIFLASPDIQLPGGAEFALVAAVCVIAYLLKGRPVAFAALAGGLAIAGVVEHRTYDVSETHRSFFGVVKLGEVQVPDFGTLRYMVHGTTIHGAEAVDPSLRCRPLTYYGPSGPIGQVFGNIEKRKPAVSFGLVGLGTGTVASFVRPSDSMRIFEIDPMVVRLASDPRRFDYVSGCAKGQLTMVVGDARQSLQREPPGRFDLILVDAFSSDSIPTHLLTVEAMRLYLKDLKPDGLVLLHLSNRNLALTRPAAAAVVSAGGAALTQSYLPPPDTPLFTDAAAIVVLAARSPEALQPFAHDARWTPADTKGVRPWTDDYSNVLGALIRRWRGER